MVVLEDHLLAAFDCWHLSFNRLFLPTSRTRISLPATLSNSPMILLPSLPLADLAVRLRLMRCMMRWTPLSAIGVTMDQTDRAIKHSPVNFIRRTHHG